VFLLVSLPALAYTPLRGDLGIHDPSTIIKCKDKYYIFGTGDNILSKSSTDKVVWTPGPTVFANPPAWTTNAVPGFARTFWAPDVIFLNGRYCLYYSVSTWGSQVSAIGLVTNPTLDPTDPAYKWTDQGIVIQSGNGSPYNTIDPSVSLDGAGNPWMVFGSYWTGIYVVQLDPVTGLRISLNSPTYRVAYNSSIEASCILRRGSYYYLFVNWGSCCDGVNSTYNIRVGRSTSITGPYIDRNGVDMANNGGTLFLQGTGKYTGPGHMGFLVENGRQWFSYHYYDANAYAGWYDSYGPAEFDLRPLSWTADNWPVFSNDWSALYRFDEDARDENAQYYGLLRGGATIEVDAERGRVLSLSGTNSFVELPPGVAYARTFSAVVKWNGGASWQRIFDFGNDTSSYLMLTPSSGNGRLRCDIRANGTTQILEASVGLPVGVWAHVALTLDGSRGVLYLNGSPVATNASMNLSPVDVRAQTNHLGRSKFAADANFNGRIAEFRVFGRALSAAEIIAPVPVISEPLQGARYAPGSTIAFQGSGSDYLANSISATGLTWTVQYLGDTFTNQVLGPITGAFTGSLLIPPTGIYATNGSYRINLTALDAFGRRATNSVQVFPDGGSPATTNWASYYPFTTGAGDASNRFNGTLLNGASIVTDAVRNKVLNLGGGSQYVNFPVGINTFRTFAAWVKWNGGAAWQRLFDFGTDTRRWVMLTPRDGEDKMQVALTSDRNTYVKVLQAPAALPTGVWTHVAIVFDGHQAILYTNGVLMAVNNSINLLPADIPANKNYFGRSQYSADAYFNGQIDSVKLSSRALSPAELFAPNATITQPAFNSTYAGGDLVSYAGSATDYTDLALGPAAFSWSAEFHHDGQVAQVFGPVAGSTSGTFLVATNGGTSTNAFYRLRLLVTDTRGKQAAASTDLLPKISQIQLQTLPAGLALNLDGQTVITPASVSAVAGLARTLSAPTPQSLAGSNYDFVLWSDGGSASRSIRVPLTNAPFTASFLQPSLGLELMETNLVLSWPSWAGPAAVFQATNLDPPVAWWPLTNNPVTSNDLKVLLLPKGTGNFFFRLQSGN
jgi:arabinan endo-1,5-alpha-L-arabinosidase